MHILIADDSPESLLILEELLGRHYCLHLAIDGQQALDCLERGVAVDLILLDVMMPRVDGFETCRRIKADPRFMDIPVLFLTGLDNPQDEEHGLSLGAVDFIHKPFSPPVVLARVRNHLQLAQTTKLLHARNASLEEAVADRTCEILRQSEQLLRREQEAVAAQSAVIIAFCALVETRDNETGNHIRRTQNYVRLLARHLRDHPRFRGELSEENIGLMYKSAPLHDVGKVGIPDAILGKPGPLNAEEWAVMKLHCQYGRDAILVAERELGEAASFLRYAREIAYGHHERWDGAGYPQGLAGEAIPLSARLMAVADVYDALISVRVYKPAFSHGQALAMIAKERGSHFDPDIVDAMLAVASDFDRVAKHYADDVGDFSYPPGLPEPLLR